MVKIRAGIKSTEFWLILVAVLLTAWFINRGAQSHQIAFVDLPAAIYAACRTWLKAKARSIESGTLETFFRRCIMSQAESGIATGVAQTLESKFVDTNASLSKLNPELDATITALANLAQKAIITYGGQLLAKLIPAPKTAAAPAATPATPTATA
jgi:hypothetical protein